MSYLALARKWRPRRFEDVLGQPHVVKAISHALGTDRLHPAILLTGTRGVGKTTLARIIAKGLNCDGGVTAEPCNACNACRQVDESRFVDLLEIDAASHTGIDNVRELIDNAQYAPSQGRYKVYLIDEVHMLSRSAFNALLKTLEEPPPHVKFILATTDPQRLPVTVLSRCLQFSLRRLPPATIRGLLTKVLEQENLTAEPAAVVELARAADGSMRDGLSLLDQAIAYAGGSGIRLEQVEEMLGTQGRRILYGIVSAVAAGDGAALLECVERLDAQAPDYAALLNDLAAIVQRAAVLNALPAAATDEDDAEVGEIAAQVPAEDLQLYYQIVVNGRNDLHLAPDPRLGFEMTLLRLLAFRPAGGTEGAGSSAGRAPARPSRPRAGSAASGNPDWAERVEALELDGFAKQLARHCQWLGREGDTVRLALDARMKHLLREDRRQLIEAALSRQSGEKLTVRIEPAAGDLESPARLDEKRHEGRQRDAVAAIESDPAVRALQERLGARVRAGSVRPLDEGSGQ